MIKPQYKHDCSKCTFLGRFKVTKECKDYYPGNKSVDLYFCKSSSDLESTVVVRYGNEDHEYSSMLVGASEQSHNLADKEAEKRARKLGLMNTKDIIAYEIKDRHVKDKIHYFRNDMNALDAAYIVDELHSALVFSGEQDLLQNNFGALALASLTQAHHFFKLMADNGKSK